MLYTYGLDRKEMFAGPDWAEKPQKQSDFSTHLSGVMLMEMAARLDMPVEKVERNCQNNAHLPQKPDLPDLKKEKVIVVPGSSTVEGIGTSSKENG